MSQAQEPVRQNPQTHARAAASSLLGLGVQAVIAVALLILGLYTESPAVAAASWFAFGGLPLWFLLLLVFQQRRLAWLEAQEAEQLARSSDAERSLFTQTSDNLSLARRRLEKLQRWGLPITSFVTSAYLIASGAVFLSNRGTEPLADLDPTNALAAPEYDTLIAVAATGVLFFVALLISLYLAGLARVAHWRLLRGGAGYLMGMAVLNAALAIGFALGSWKLPHVLAVLGAAIPIFSLVIGAEMALAFVLERYRPRAKDELPRPAFDSRLLGLLTSPKGIARTIHEAINYQFGFEITRTWFWQLLTRASLPLLGASVTLLVLLSCVVIVDGGQQALVLRFGRISGEPLKPGLSLKAPWPISVVRRYDVGEVRQIVVGSPRHSATDAPRAILWTGSDAQDSEDPKDLFLVAAPPATRDGAAAGDDSASARPLAVSLANVEIAIQYRIKDVQAFVESSADPDALFAALAEREVTRQLLRVDLDGLLNASRDDVGRALRENLQKAVNAREIGVDVLFVGVVGVRPPRAAAEAFHAPFNAALAKDALIEEARRKAIEFPIQVAGSQEHAIRIIREIEAFERLVAAGEDRDKIRRQEGQVDSLLRVAGGEAARIIAEARAYRWRRENGERGRAEHFQGQLAAYRQAPDYYRQRQQLAALREGLQGARKYLIIGDRERMTVRMDFKETDLGLAPLLPTEETRP